MRIYPKLAFGVYKKFIMILKTLKIVKNMINNMKKYFKEKPLQLKMKTYRSPRKAVKLIIIVMSRDGKRKSKL